MHTNMKYIYHNSWSWKNPKFRFTGISEGFGSEPVSGIGIFFLRSNLCFCGVICFRYQWIPMLWIGQKRGHGGAHWCRCYHLGVLVVRGTTARIRRRYPGALSLVTSSRSCCCRCGGAHCKWRSHRRPFVRGLRRGLPRLHWRCRRWIPVDGSRWGGRRIVEKRGGIVRVWIFVRQNLSPSVDSVNWRLGLYLQSISPFDSKF